MMEPNAQDRMKNQEQAETVWIDLGEVGIVPAAQAALEVAGKTSEEFLARHRRGDWGDLPAHEKAMNDRSVREGMQVCSLYTLETGEQIEVISDFKWGWTSITLAEEN